MKVNRLKGLLAGLAEACSSAIREEADPLEFAQLAADLLVEEIRLARALQDELRSNKDVRRYIAALNCARVGATEIAEQLASPPRSGAGLVLNTELQALRGNAQSAYELFHHDGQFLKIYTAPRVT